MSARLIGGRLTDQSPRSSDFPFIRSSYKNETILFYLNAAQSPCAAVT